MIQTSSAIVMNMQASSAKTVADVDTWTGGRTHV